MSPAGLQMGRYRNGWRGFRFPRIWCLLFGIVYRREIQQISDTDRESRVAELKRQVTLLKEEETQLSRLHITGNLTEEADGQLHCEWQEKLWVNELNLAELEREARVHISDLDLALALMSKIGDLYSRLEPKQRGTLLQIFWRWVSRCLTSSKDDSFPLYKKKVFHFI